MTVQPQPIVKYGHLETSFVYYDDLDAMGILHNARYAVLLERALGAFWTRHGYTFADGVYTQPDACVAVAEFSIKYRAPVRGSGEIGIHFWLDVLSDSSAVYGFRVLSADGATVHAEGRRVHIRLDPATLRPTSWTPACRHVAQTLLHA